ncbi:MAG TPA: GntR family transcriptional regulator [Propionibacteriaceae bacterium]|jgi:DNA-binding transcriptional regulator YhcF (GntR family)
MDGLELTIAIDSTSPVPPFEQLRSQIAGLVAAGALPAGTKLPTVRQLGTDLGLAANTVARSYRELEADGVLVTAGRRGTYVHSGTLHDAGPSEIASRAQDYATAARRSGLSVTEAVQLVERAWRGSPGDR